MRTFEYKHSAPSKNRSNKVNSYSKMISASSEGSEFLIQVRPALSIRNIMQATHII